LPPPNRKAIRQITIQGEKMSKMQTTTMLLVCLSALALMPAANASEWNQRTVFTFSGPVEIPGQILPAGTYVFKLADSSSNRHIVQVFNKEENHVFATFLAIPDYRLHPSDKTIVKFAERPAGSPEAIKGWFYPGRNYGHEFVYPKTEAVALAEANDTPVPSIPVSVTLNRPALLEMDMSFLKAERPTGEEVELRDAFAIDAAQASSEPTEQPAELPAQLPKTGTSLPLVGLLGLLSLGTAVTLRFARSK
jgi:hypothetical protein